MSPDKWVQARQRVQALEHQDNLAQRLLAKAKERTIDVTCLGESFKCKWPSSTEFLRIQREFQDIEKAAGEEDEDAVDTIVRRICEVAADLIVDDSVTAEVLQADDYGAEVALEVCQAASTAVQEAKQAVASFRGSTRGS